MALISRVPREYSRNPEQLQFGDDMAIQVFGGMQQAGGFKQAHKEHRLHNAKQGDELLQVSEGLDHNEPRAPYLHQSFPTMLYKPDPGEKGQKVVMNATEKSVALQDGWRDEPYPVVQVAVLDPATEKKNLMDTNNQLQAQIVVQQETLNRMAAEAKETRDMLAELLKTSKKKTE